MNDITIDEVEARELNQRVFISQIITRILQLSFASCCSDAIWGSLECEGCQYGWPSQKDHLCAIFYDDDVEEAWNYCYDDATEMMDSNIVWERAEEVAEMVGIKIHASWRNFISELFREARTTVYNYYSQISRNNDISIAKRINQVLIELDPELDGNGNTLSNNLLLTYSPTLNCSR